MSATETKTATSSPLASDKLPSEAVVQEILGHEVVDKDGKKHALNSLLNASGEAGRVLVVFIRHFYCSFCQEYIRTLSTSLSPSRLSALSPATRAIVIGHGDPALISKYIAETGCAFPIYADQSRILYDRLGFVSNLRGVVTTASPDYVKRGKLELAWDTIRGYAFGGTKMFSSGKVDQNGGELMFSDGKIEWLHRMTTTADHAEVKDLEAVLGA